MSKGGSVGSQGTTQQARGSFSGNSRPSYGGNQAGGLGSKGGSQSYQQPYRSPYGQGPSYSQHGMRSGFGGFMENPQAMPTQNPNFSQTDSNGNFTSTPSGGQMMMFQPPRRQEEARTRGPESLEAQGLQGIPQYFNQQLPVLQQLPVSGDNNTAEASMRIGQVAPQQFSGGFGSKGGVSPQFDRGYRSGIGGFF